MKHRHGKRNGPLHKTAGNKRGETTPTRGDGASRMFSGGGEHGSQDAATPFTRGRKSSRKSRRTGRGSGY